MQTVFPLIKVDQEIREWLNKQGVLDEELVCRISQANGFLPADEESRLKSHLELDGDCQKIFSELLSDSNGIPLGQFGIKPEEWHFAIKDGDCACCKLVNLGLARNDESEYRLKALPIAFSEQVQFLIGMTNSL